MSDLEYPLNTSWNVDIMQDSSLPQDLSSIIPQRGLASGLTGQYTYQPRQRESSFHHHAQPWVVPSSSTYAVRRQNLSNNRRMRHVSTPLRNANTASRAPVDGLMIHVEKRARNVGPVAQIPLPSSLPAETSPTARRLTSHTVVSRASSQSFPQDDAASAAPSNGPITPNISPVYNMSQEPAKPTMTKTFYGMDTRVQGSLDEDHFEQEYLPPDLSFIEQQPGLWDMGATFPQSGTSYGYYNYPSRYVMPPQESFVYSAETPYLDGQYLAYRRSFTVPEQLKTSAAKKPTRKHFTPEVTTILKSWFKDNLHRPYPSEETKQELLRQTGLTMNQLSNWFINARRRNWKRSRLAKDV